MYSLKKHLPSIAICCVASYLIPAANAVNLITNGGFETTTNGTNKQIGTLVGSESKFTTLPGWYTTNAATANPAFNLVFAAGAGETVGAANRFAGLVTFYGLSNTGANTFVGVSPSGGNYVAIDGGFDVGALNQQISGLTVGQDYTLSFSWAVAQQSGFEAPAGLTEKLVVTLGGQTIETPTISYVNHGFKGWFSQTMTFKADSASPILSFLSVGTPTGQPPFALLDGVSLQAVPEPSSCLIGALTLSSLMLRRRRSAEVF